MTSPHGKGRKDRIGRNLMPLALLAALGLVSLGALRPACAAGTPSPAPTPPPAVCAAANPATTPQPVFLAGTFLCTDTMTNPCDGAVTTCSLTCPTGDHCMCGVYEFFRTTGPGCIATLVGRPTCVP